MLLETCYYVTRLVLSLQTPINTLWSECAGYYSVQHGKVFKNFPWTFYVPENVAEVFLCVLKCKSCWPCLKCVLLQCWMIIVWGEKKNTESNICLPHLCLLTSPPYWSLQDISWLAHGRSVSQPLTASLYLPPEYSTHDSPETIWNLIYLLQTLGQDAKAFARVLKMIFSMTVFTIFEINRWINKCMYAFEIH